MKTRLQPNLSESYIQQQIQLSLQYIQELGVKEHIDRVYLSHRLHDPKTQ